MKANKKNNAEPRMTFASPTFGTDFERRITQPNINEEVQEPKKSSFRSWLKRGLLLISGIVLIIVLVFGWQFYSVASKLTNQKDPIRLLFSIFPRSLAENGGRVNILLAGYSIDDPSHGGAELTDSIMIVSINPKLKRATLISVPRDLWVNIPGVGYRKINAAYEDGQTENFSQAGSFPGGMGLLEQIVSQNFGVNFNYYALIDYNAFKDAVNAVGGIRINIQSTDPRGLFDAYTNLKLPNGLVELNGQQALNLSRARGDNAAGDISYGFAGSDYERTQHQQQMLVALKDKASQVSSIIDPLTVLKLTSAVGNNVQTNLSIGQIETLYSDTKGVSNKNIDQITLNSYNGTDYLSGYSVYSQGSYQEAVIPAAGLNNYSQIQSVVNQLLYGQQ